MASDTSTHAHHTHRGDAHLGREISLTEHPVHGHTAGELAGGEPVSMGDSLHDKLMESPAHVLDSGPPSTPGHVSRPVAHSHDSPSLLLENMAKGVDDIDQLVVEVEAARRDFGGGASASAIKKSTSTGELRAGVKWADLAAGGDPEDMSPAEPFTPSSEKYTPQIGRKKVLKYVPPEQRQETVAPTSTIARPDFDDTLRRVSVILYQHIHRGEMQRQGRVTKDGETVLPAMSQEAEEMSDVFHEELYVKPRWRYRFPRVVRGAALTAYAMEVVEMEFSVPTAEQIYVFAEHLFTRAQLSAECSIVCLVYVERLMETAGVLLLATNWRTILLCGLLMASKVWQDLSSWNIEFCAVYPQYTLAAINRLERAFLQAMRWDLYIAGSVYAKYYFALRSMSEKKNFRRRYISMMNVNPPNVRRIAAQSRTLKKQLYSKSL